MLVLPIKWTPEKRKAYNKRMREKYASDPEYRKMLSDRKKKYRSSRRKEILEKEKLRRFKLRKSVIDRLGGECVHCGFTDIRALQIDHINGGGNKKRRHYGVFPYYNMMMKMLLEDFLKEYQCLCANCNWIKRHTNDEYQHSGTKVVYDDKYHKKDRERMRRKAMES